MTKIDSEHFLKKKHFCTNCKKEFIWDKYCYWYGTPEETEFKACSVECKREIMDKKFRLN